MMEMVYWGVEIVILVYALKSRRSALIAIAFSLPLSRRLPALPVPLLNYQNLLVMVSVLSFIIHKPDPDDRRTRVKYWVPLGLLMIFFTVGWVISLSYEPELYQRFWSSYRNTVLFRSFMLSLTLYIMSSLMVRNRQSFDAVVKAGLGGMIAEAAYGIAEYVILKPGRVTGHLGEANSAGAFFATACVILVALTILLPRTHQYWKHSAVGAALASIALVGTLSRGSLLAAMLGLGLLTFFVNKRVFAVGVLVLALSPLWIPESIKARMNETVTTQENLKYRFRVGGAADDSALLSMINQRMDASSADARLDSSSQARILVWTLAVKMMMDRPLGSGFGVFPWEVHHYTESMWFKATHNIYLKIGAENGIQALLSFLALLACLCAGCWKLWSNPVSLDSSALAAGMLFGTICLMFNALFVDLFFQLESTGTYWFLMGALLQAPILFAGNKTPESSINSPVQDSTDDEPKPLYELV